MKFNKLLTLFAALLLSATTAWADDYTAYITDLILVGGTPDEVSTAKTAHSDYTFIDYDLNKDAGGNYIYLGYKNGSRANTNGGYITDIIVVKRSDYTPPTEVTHNGRTYYICPYAGGSEFVTVKGHLNCGCGGSRWDLYLYYTKVNFNDKRAVSSITVNNSKGGAINSYENDGNGNYDNIAEGEIDLNRGIPKSGDVYMHITTATKTNRPSSDPVMKSGLVYNGSAQQLLTISNSNTGTMKYRVGTSGNFSSTIPTATTPGTYTVYYYADANEYGNPSNTYSKTVTISKANNNGVTVSCANALESAGPSPSVSGNLSTGNVTYQYSTSQNGTYSGTEPNTAGTYWVKATIATDNNYNAFTTAAVKFTLKRDWTKWNNGDSEADAYVITSTEDLDLLASRVNSGTNYSGKYFKVDRDITYSHTTAWDNSSSTENNFTPIGYSSSHVFKGHFDGQGHTISGIRVTRVNDDYNGLFGYLAGGTVKNVILSDARIVGYDNCAGIAGYCQGSTITNCWVKSNVGIGGQKKRGYVGGIASNLLDQGTISGCRCEATLITNTDNGGIVSYISSGSQIRHCVVIGATVPGTCCGAIACNIAGTFTNNYYTGCTVAGTANATNVGYNGNDYKGACYAVAIGAATGVTITPTGTATTYDVSGITAYEGNNGIICDRQLYAGATETLTLNISYTAPEGHMLNGFTDGNGKALTDKGNGTYSLTMTTAPTVTPTLIDCWGITKGRDGSTAEKAYLITTTAGLDLLAQNVNSGTENVDESKYSGKYFELGDNITYDGTENNYTPIGTQYKKFAGYFDGKGHTISGIRINKEKDEMGIFGVIYEAEVKNLTLDNSQIVGVSRCGGIVGNNIGTVSNCHVTANVTIHGSSLCTGHGGIVGRNGRYIFGCTSSANVTATSNLNCADNFAGIAGDNSAGTVENCLVYGGSINGNSKVGAVVGENDENYGTLTNNRYTHNVKVNDSEATPDNGTGNGHHDGANFICAIIPGESVTLNIPSESATTEYPYDGLKIYPTGMSYNGHYYNNIDGNVTFTATYTGNVPDNYILSFGHTSSATTTNVDKVWDATDGTATCTLKTDAAADYYIVPIIEPINYTINYNGVEGANFTTTNPTTYTVVSEAITLNNPTKEGYTFLGWTYEGQSEPTKSATIAHGSTGNKEFTANWGKNMTESNVDDIATQTYTGSAIEPTVVVTDGETTLTLGTDYTVSYSSNTNAGVAYAIVRFKGNYSGTVSKTFTINPKTLGLEDITISEIAAQTYTGAAIEPTFTVKYGVTTLTLGTDYTVSYSDNTNVGKAKATVSLKGNYLGSATTKFTITTKTLEAGDITISEIAAQTYTGEAYEPNLTVKYGETPLTLNTDYTVSYSDNTNAGTAKATISLKGNYSGSVEKTFTIDKKAVTAKATAKNRYYDGTYDANGSISLEGVVSGEQVSATYTTATFANKNVEQGKTVSFNGISLTGSDKGNYTLSNTTATTTADIIARDLVLSNFTASNKVYDGTTEAAGSFSDNRLSGDKLEFSYNVAFANANVVADGNSVNFSNITISGGADKDNYNLVTLSGSAAADITPITDEVVVTYIIPDARITYDGEEHLYMELTEEQTSVAESNNELYDVTAQHALGKLFFPAAGAEAFSAAIMNVKGTNVGEYPLGWNNETFVNVSPNFTNVKFNVTDGKLIIEPAAVTVTADNKEKTYGDPEPTFTATVTGLVNGESESLITYTISRAEGENVGEYDITPAGDEVQGNYAVTYVAAKLTISPAVASVTHEGVTTNYETPGDAIAAAQDGDMVKLPIGYLGETINGVKYGDFIYDANSDKKKILAYIGNDANVTIPADVEIIGEKVFIWAEWMESVTIPENAAITNIEDWAFAQVGNVINNSSYTEGQPWGAWKLNGNDGGFVCQPDFYPGRYILTRYTGNGGDITIPYGVSDIRAEAFEYCESLTSVKIPETVDYIGEEAFAGCYNLNFVTVPSSVTYIGYMAFYGVKHVINNSSYTEGQPWGAMMVLDGEIDGDFVYEPNTNKTVLWAYIGKGGDVTIPETVKTIGDGAFAQDQSLTSVTIPDGVETIGAAAFCECYNLKLVTVPSSVTSIGGLAFEDVKCVINNSSCTDENNWRALVVNGEIDEDGFVYEPNTNKTVLLAYIGSDSVITIPESVRVIGKWAFSSCTSLTSVTIPKSVETIDNGAFAYGQSLTSVTIPDGVETIGAAAFCECYNLKLVTVPSSVTSIGGLAFEDVKCVINNSSCTDENNWGALVVNGEIDEDGFVYEPNTNKTVLLAYIGKGGEVTIPKSVKIIDNRAFKNCDSLTSVTIPESVETIGIGAFGDCTSLTSVIIPNSVETIGMGAFDGCTSLTSVTISESVTDIYGYAFDGCYEIEIIYCSANPESLNGVENLPGYETSLEITYHVPAEYLESWEDIDGFGENVTFVTDIKSINAEGITIADIVSQTYTGNILTPVIEVKDGDKTLVEGIDYTVTLSKYSDEILEVGSLGQVVDASVGGDENLVEDLDEIIDAPVEGNENLVVDDDEIVAVPEKGCINAGNYTITITGKKLYYKSAEKTFTINPANVTVTAESKTKTYGDSEPEFTATVTGLVNGESESLISYTISRAEGENVGDYTITPSGAENQGNYAVSYVEGTLKINKAVPTYTLPTITAQPCNAKLADIQLGNGFAFAANSAELAIGENKRMVVFTPENTDNYEVVENIELTINVSDHVHAAAVYENVKAATCTVAGSQDSVVYCSVCNKELARKTVEIPVIAHTPGEAVAENYVPSTTTTEGSVDSVVYCTVCKKELSRETFTIPVSNHEHIAGAPVAENYKAPTCAVAGSVDSVVYCTVCNTELSRKTVEIPVIAHTPGEAVAENHVPSTTTTEGSVDSVVYCTVCKKELSRETFTIPVSNHEHIAGAPVAENYKAPTCAVAGSVDSVVYCTVCNTELSRKTVEIPVIAHTPGEAVAENHVPSTTTTEGSVDSVVYCTVCKKELSRETFTIPVSNHEHIAGAPVAENYKAPTCAVAGSVDSVVYCTVCNTELSRKTVEIDATGHTPGEAVIENIVEATYTAAGSYDSVVYCTVCHAELSRVTIEVPQLVKPAEAEVVEVVISQTNYTVGDSLKLDGGKLVVATSDSTTAEVVITPEMVSGFNPDSVGVQTVTVSFEIDGVPYTTTFDVTVKDVAKPIDAEVVISQTNYTVGDSLKLDGGKLVVATSDSTTAEVVITPEMVSGFNPDSVGVQTVTISFEIDGVPYTTTFEVEVKEPEVIKVVAKSLAVSAPTKVTYKKGETLDVSGGKLTVTFSDNSTKEFDLKANMVSGFDANKVGKQKITVKYTIDGVTLTATFDVTVEADNTAISDDEAVAVNIYAYGNTIVVENATEDIYIYNAMGALVDHVNAAASRTEIIVNGAEGVYIVKTSNTAKRVMVK